MISAKLYLVKLGIIFQKSILIFIKLILLFIFFFLSEANYTDLPTLLSKFQVFFFNLNLN